MSMDEGVVSGFFVVFEMGCQIYPEINNNGRLSVV